jgi:hypothetical protein
MIKVMPAGGGGIRDIGIMLRIDSAAVLDALTSTKCKIKPKQPRYDCLETDGFWTYVGANLYISPGKRGKNGGCAGEAEPENGKNSEETDTRTGDKLRPDSSGRWG